MKNPFVTNGYAGAEYFCDRAQETEIIRELLVNENNIALISPRRIGKTDLIWHVFDAPVIQKNYHCFVVDIYATKNLGDFVNMLGKALVIFSGSQRHMMDGMFTSPSRTFYQAVTIVNLQPLDLSVYTDFCVSKFEEAGKRLDKTVVSLLYGRFEAVTSYMHRVMSVLFSRTDKGETCVVSMVDEAVDFIIRLSSDTYESLIYQMPEKQRFS